jgi:hypothetical protein
LFFVNLLQGTSWKKMADAVPGAMFGFCAFVSGGGVAQCSVMVDGPRAVVLKIPPPLQQAADHNAVFELHEFAAECFRRESEDIAQFLAKERCRPLSSCDISNTHHKVCHSLHSVSLPA